MDGLLDSLTRLVEAVVVLSVLDAVVRTVDRMDPAGAEARDALTDEGLASFLDEAVPG